MPSAGKENLVNLEVLIGENRTTKERKDSRHSANARFVHTPCPPSQRAQRSKKFEISSEIENFERE